MGLGFLLRDRALCGIGQMQVSGERETQNQML
jgi:hypothetical protein